METWEQKAMPILIKEWGNPVDVIAQQVFIERTSILKEFYTNQEIDSIQ